MLFHHTSCSSGRAPRYLWISTVRNTPVNPAEVTRVVKLPLRLPERVESSPSNDRVVIAATWMDFGSSSRMSSKKRP